MKRFLSVCACLVLVSLVLIPRASVYSQRRDNAKQLYADDRIVVKLKGESAADVDSLAEEIVRAPGVRAEALSRRHSDSQLIHLNQSMSVEEALSRASADPRVEYAEPDYFVYATDTVPNDPYFAAGQMWGLSQASCQFCSQQSPNIDATRAWDITTGSDDVIAVVLDTGVDLQHEDLAPNAWVNPGETAGDGKDNDGNGFIDDVNGWNFYDGSNQTFTSASEDFHGTHVAGSIGAVGNNGLGVAGVAWHVKIISLKFLGGPQGKGSTGNAVRGINYAIDLRNRGFNVRVINASWGGGGNSQALHDAISAANDAGILFVCAAGNDGFNIDDTPSYPGSYAGDLAGTISVAAVDWHGALASFSNYGHGSVSLAAPGVQIESTYPGNNYTTLSGTSMSTPYVSGIAVLLWSQEPSLSPKQVKQRIVDTSEPLNSLASMVARSGRASAYAALTNTIDSPQSPVIAGRPQFTKHSVTIDGFGFVDGSSVIEVDGTPLAGITYDSSFALANGTLTRLVADIGKKPLKRAFPSGVSVTIDVMNPTTGQRSPQIVTARF
jgi:subtilisin family serine protease